MATFTCLLIVATTVGFTSSFLFGTKELYSANDPVVQLNSTTIKATIYRSHRAWIVEFYNSWCGHCVSFAPTWIQLANDVRKWKSVIDVAAIDCASESNTAVCRHFEIVGFPTIKFFKPNCEDNDLGSNLGHGVRDLVFLRQSMVDFIDQQGLQDSKWPILKPITESSWVNVWKYIFPSVNLLAVIIEDPSTYFAREVILDTARLRNYIEVRRVAANSTLTENLDTSWIPTTHIFERGKDKPIEMYVNIRHKDKRGDLVERLEKLAQEKGYNINETTISPIRKEEPASEDKKLLEAVGADDNRKEDGETESNTRFTTVTDMDHAYEQDLENTIFYLFHHEVSIQKIIRADKFNALKDFIEILDKYYPGRYAVTVILNKLLKWVRTKSEINGDEFQEKFDQLRASQGGTPLSKQEWIGCKRSLRHLDGYTCGLWTLFHTLTVSAYKKNVNDADNHLEVLHAVRSYVASFFGCEECAGHFASMSKTMDSEVSKREDGVLWLWQAHNRVNLRLKGSPSDDPTHPKVQFPTVDMCSNCQTTSDDGTQWDLHAVLDFLVYHYGDMGIVQISPEDVAARSSVPQEDVSTSRDVWKRNIEKVEVAGPRKSYITGWGFTTLDVSLCVLLYVVSLVILLTGYFCIIVRRRSILNQIKRRTLQYINLV